MKRWLRLVAIPASLVMLAAACSTSDGKSDNTSATTAAPATSAAGATTTAGGATTTSAGATTSGASTTLPPTPGPSTAGSVTVFGVEDSASEAGAEQAALKAFG